MSNMIFNFSYNQQIGTLYCEVNYNEYKYINDYDDFIKLYKSMRLSYLKQYFMISELDNSQNDVLLSRVLKDVIIHELPGYKVNNITFNDNLKYCYELGNEIFSDDEETVILIEDDDDDKFVDDRSSISSYSNSTYYYELDDDEETVILID